MVDLVADYIDEGAPEMCVNGVAAVQRISQGQMMVTYYERRDGDTIVVARLIWDRQEWLQMWKLWDNNRAAISSESFEKPPSDDVRKEMH